MPVEQMNADFVRHYPHMYDDLGDKDFDREVDAEVAANN